MEEGLKVVVASKNPVKQEAARIAFTRMFPEDDFLFESVSVPSGVSDQPRSDEETYRGALNRIKAARAGNPDADYYISFEGGVEKREGELMAFAWAAVEDQTGRFGKGRSATLILPPEVARLISEGKELGEADDIVFGRTNSKQENGAVGILTHDAITRTSYYADAGVLALIPFKNPTLYPH